MTARIFMIPKNHEYINIMKKNLESVGVDVQVLKPFHWASFENIFKLIKYYRKGYRIIHVHWLYIFPLSIIMKLFYYACHLFNIKIIWEMHNILPHGYNETDRKNASWFYRKSDAIIFHSREDIKRSKQQLGSKISKKNIIIPHGNFNESYKNEISKKDARKILNIPKDKKVILCFGFIRSNRGYEYLIKATEGMENIFILIVGKIWHHQTYKKLIDYNKKRKDILVIAKYIPDDEMQIYFNACDIVVLPYTEITTSGVIPAAYAFKKPVIASATGGIKDVVNENTGLLVPPKDYVSLRKAIERIFTRDLGKMGNEAYKFAEEEFNWQTIAYKIKQFYSELFPK